ncbi:alpha/beta fold hydrolase [Pseudonocardia humida]|uniref:Alpha/beta hydrolase n=1 Tax=Pseudonocardia humida TaxID=2800819 RepID=A0ABT0ZY67_9PSEU|nr:alpha/beta fold hydrolase [Pseudonocardia humida]MCO1655564.1 alpha/beta hydrolase [Pseudonocardia humida]
MTTTGTGTTLPGALRHLADYTAATLSATTREIARVTSRSMTDALAETAAGRRGPLDAATRALTWWTVLADRRTPDWHTPNQIVFSTPFAHLRDMTRPDHRDDDVVPTLLLPPQAGHSSHIVDYSADQSQVGAITEAGLTRLHVLEWRSATAATRHVSITDYLDVIERSIRLLGGRVNLVGDCQGGWLAAIYAALHPHRVHTLTLAGAPIDFHAGDSVIASTTRALTSAFGLAPYRALVAANGGVMPGRAALANFIAIRPQAELSRQWELLAHLTDDAHVRRYRAFDDWFTHTQDLPGAFYLWLVEHLFRRNELISGELVVDGRRADPAAITCPLFLLAGETDHITPAPQLFALADVVGTPAERITLRTARGGHLGLFMGHDALRTDWPALLSAVRALS